MHTVQLDHTSGAVMRSIIGKSSSVKAEEYRCFNAAVFLELLPFCIAPLLLLPGLSPDWQSLWARWRRESLLAGRKWGSDRALFTTSRHYVTFMHERVKCSQTMSAYCIWHMSIPRHLLFEHGRRPGGYNLLHTAAYLLDVWKDILKKVVLCVQSQ